MSSGLLDVERRIEAAALELLNSWTPLTPLVKQIIRRRDASIAADYPCAYVEAYNMVEYSMRTGNYLGGLRLGAMTYQVNDRSSEVVKQIIGALRMWMMQEDLAIQFTATTSAQTFGSYLTVIAFEQDEGASYEFQEGSDKLNERILETTIVARPSR